MKTSILLAMSAAIATFGAFAADSQWTYNSTAGTISDGDWTFAATVSGTDLTVGAVSVDPGEGATLDFSKSVTDGSATYTIVTLNPNFAAYANKANLATLVLPTAGLVTISTDAFNGCTSLASISPFLPDSVTTVGERAFKSVPAQQDLSLKGVVTVSKSAFYGCGVLSVTFGPGLKYLYGGWDSGCFWKCEKMKTLNFDPGMTDATISGESVFAYTSLEGVVDLRGFKDVGNRPFYYYYNGKISKLILSSSAIFRGNLMHSMGSTKQVEFDGGVPPTQTPTFYSHFDQSHLSDLYIVVPEEYKDEWAAYCEGGVINDVDSYWSTNFVTRAQTQRIHLIYKSASSGGDLGTWIYDESAGIVTNTVYGWSFRASNAAKTLSVGSCITYPAAPSPLDFSASVTDTEGGTMYFVTLNPSMCVGNASAPADCGLAISEIIFPAERLNEIGNYAFAWATNVTRVTPFLPDSVTTVGVGAFKFLPVEQDLSLLGAVTVKASAFHGSGILTVTFGASLVDLQAGWETGAFKQCTKLSAVIFDDGMSGGNLGQTTFSGCSAITGTIDLSGFTTIGNSPFYGSGANITKVRLSSGLTQLGSVINTLSKVRAIEFDGGVPTAENFYKQFEATSSTDFYIVVPEAYTNGWSVYCEGDGINDFDSYWSTNFVATAQSRGIHLIYAPTASAGGGLGEWIYADGIVTNTVNGWAFSAMDAGMNIFVGSCLSYPSVPSVLDFSSSITDANGVPLRFCSINTALYSGYVAGPTDAGLAVGELILPETGLHEIGKGAFAYCTNLVHVSPLLPDSVTTVGESAFFHCPVEGDLRAIGLSTLNSRSFKCMNITSATFGPELKRINGGYLSGPVSECPNLTNIVFDAAMSNCVINGEMAFHDNPKLVGIGGIVDCSGISRIDAPLTVRPFHGCTQITNLVFGEDLTFLKSDILRTLYNLKSVTFNGPPPENVEGIFNEPTSEHKIKTTQKVVTYIRKKYKDDWLDYAEGGVINGRAPSKPDASTWKREYIDVNVTDLSMRPLVTLEPDSGLYIIVR